MRFFTTTSVVLTTLAAASSVSAHQAGGRKTYAAFSDYHAKYINSDAAATSETLRLVKRGDVVGTATAYLKTLVPDAEFELNKDQYTDEDTGITHLYFTQTLNGLKIENAVANVNIDADGTVLSAGSSLVSGKIAAPAPLERRQNRLTPLQALNSAKNAKGYPIKTEKSNLVVEDNLDGQQEFTITDVEGAVTEPKAKLAYYVKDGQVKLTWKLDTDLDESYMVTYVDAIDGSVTDTIDWVSDADYLVYPLGVNDPTDGKRVKITNPFNRKASPQGWHESGTEKYTTTWGNNGIAQENWSGGAPFLNNSRPDGGRKNKYEFPYDPTAQDPKTYVDAAVTQLFYTSNEIHDLYEVLGFTEAAGNFENVNTGPGGLGGDSVQLNAQDGSGFNNANFRTPPDGSTTTPRMRMYIWNGGDAPRDGDFESGIVIHEYTHGLSNRLTGGPLNVNCLSTLEAGGMGEGWGDFYATALRIKKKDTRNTDYGMGNWANNGAGIRKYDYSTSLERNPMTYSWVGTTGFNVVHAIGSIWASILYEVVWNLEDKHGYHADPYPVWVAGKSESGKTTVPKHGRHLAMKLVMDGMKLQPCYPTFLTARDAIIDADKALTGGKNKCELWAAFAKRGLGTDAAIDGTTRIDGFTVPEDCVKTGKGPKRMRRSAKPWETI